MERQEVSFVSVNSIYQILMIFLFEGMNEFLYVERDGGITGHLLSPGVTPVLTQKSGVFRF